MGVDASRTMVAEATARAAGSGAPVSFTAGSALAVPFPDQAFDRCRAAFNALVRSLRLGYRASPLLIVVAFVTTVSATVPDALFAAGLAMLVHAVIEEDGGRITLVAALLGLLATGSWLLGVVN